MSMFGKGKSLCLALALAWLCVAARADVVSAMPIPDFGAPGDEPVHLEVGPYDALSLHGVEAPSAALLGEAAGAAAAAWTSGNLWSLRPEAGALALARAGQALPAETWLLDLPASGPAAIVVNDGSLVIGTVSAAGSVDLHSIALARGVAVAGRPTRIASLTPGFAYERLHMVASPALSGALYAIIGTSARRSEILFLDRRTSSELGRLVMDFKLTAGIPVGRSHLLLLGREHSGGQRGWLLQIDTRRPVNLPLPSDFPQQVEYALPLGTLRDGGRLALLDSGGQAWILDVKVKPRLAGLSTLDTWMLVGYLFLVLLIGAVCGRRVASGKELFLGGGRVPGWASGISIVLTNISAISFIALPSRAFALDSTFLLFFITPVVAAPIVILFIIPALRKGAYMTAYEVLGVNFGNGFRRLGAWFYCIYELGRTGVLLVVPSIIISMMTGMSITGCILVTALITTAYTSFGGFEAVVWTDVAQGLIMLIALVATPLVVFFALGSPVEALQIAYDAGRYRLIDPSPSLGREGWLALILCLATSFNSYLWHQPTVQRLLSGRDEKAVKSAVISAAISSPVLLSLMFFGGGLLFAFYFSFPERMSIALDGRDEVFPSFVMREMPLGLGGLVVAAIFAASMSSLSSGINSISSVISGDLVSSRLREKLVESRSFSRWISVAAGITGSVIALVVARASALSLFDVFIEFTGLLSGSLAGMFALALFCRRYRAVHAVVGFVGSIVTVAAAKFSGNFSFMLYGTIGVAACLFFAKLSTLVFPRDAVAGQ